MTGTDVRTGSCRYLLNQQTLLILSGIQKRMRHLEQVEIPVILEMEEMVEMAAAPIRLEMVEVS